MGRFSGLTKRGHLSDVLFQMMNTWNKRKRVKPAGPFQKKESVNFPRHTKISSLLSGEGAEVEGTVVSVSPLIVEEDHAQIEVITVHERNCSFQLGERIRAVGFVTKRNQKLCFKAFEITKME